MGYLLMALVAVKQGSLPALLFYLAVYALMDLGAFGMLGALSEPGEDLDALVDLQGLGYSRPWRGAILGVCVLSLAGLPPTAGFLGKFILFWAVIQANFIILAIIGVVTAIISIYFYFKVLVSLYLRSAFRQLLIPQLDVGVGLAGAAIVVAIVWLGINPSPLLAVITDISAFWAQ
jgi:NADH-quinone oxidoreductase subunit N